MVKFLRNYGFFLFLGILVLLFLSCITLISLAPHNDAKMRGFTPCSYQMVGKLTTDDNLKYSDVFFIMAEGYGCYFKVMGEGIALFYKGEQPTPWANYLFEEETFDIDDEPFDADLEQNNLLNDEVDFDDFLTERENIND